MEISLVLNPTAAQEKVVLDGLFAFNAEAGGPANYQPFAVLVGDDAGKPVGGLTGRIAYDWLFVGLLHLPPDYRGKGIGTAVMAEAERFARDRGLVGIWLDTYSFQARGFYEKLGFSVFGTLEGHPRGGARYFLQKRF